ncbi:Atg7p KNAG_0E00720 [Huiozyma naganishii CBS 8797]|uniref:Ubiquitin-like modifier-activating enzyme ATG7 n=1 Tax=Huiozyma naganishii (strain ATCC MYA-139 / BCRC 22969 / CBS 8797 / KCTC 17520 / NBRC 10181 / NCYC 3082 / Yp74L-3) TaxID=1071383 RepID=J7R656_HUIN7|nr:hypothetical protein KNAG_0E00720 [Kazachstania naganishii CBS 8797]CCK70340.1 hypothetical protein KNAG_0E00720 [Kazachstania naganishii CBS 8797]
MSQGIGHLKYGPSFQSFIDASFFQELSRLKLEVLKLNEQKVPLYSKMDLLAIPESSNSASLFLGKQNFEVESATDDGNGLTVDGAIYNFNTLEEFKSLDKQRFLHDRAADVWEACQTNINNCFKFSIISFADLKTYKYYYWVCVPALIHANVSISVARNLSVSREISETAHSWFKLYPNDWVAVLTEHDTICAYSLEAAKTCKALYLRDCCNVKNTPSTITKTILSKYYSDCPERKELDVFFFREMSSSFGYTLEFQSNGAEQDSVDAWKISGWERNVSGKLVPRFADLSKLIDPLKVSEQSVDLNLKLMKWRIVPDLNLDIVKKSRVLILGAGTLGCHVSRSLLAWGVRKITLVDNSNISLSNPVRQPLFRFQDCGKPKAGVAAQALKDIFPMVDATGIQLTVPMIGHPIINDAKEEEEYNTLVRLIDEHDAIFLLMDSRETRWLPSVLGDVKGKIVISAALGFDSYLVIRHGIYQRDEDGGGKRLGCYFCHDVVVPTDSLADKTLDQMCTVTRPGVALMASAQAVELLVSILQNGIARDTPNNSKSILGDIPHQIRGFLNHFTTLKLETPAYEHCPACSSSVVEKCRELGWKFVQNSLNDSEYIEELSGLKTMKMELEEQLNSLNMDETQFDDNFEIIA